MTKLFLILLLFLMGDCWTAYEQCVQDESVRAFTNYMTGPGGKIVMTVGDKQFTILPSDLWMTWRFDLDDDGDVDLKDWHLKLEDK